MRRQKDGWVNATHILKVANFDKPQRTRILEKEVQKGIHEKIQGGYGKYQGTWVPLDTARDLAYQYRVDDVLLPLFNFRPSSTSPPPPVKRSAKPKPAVRASSTMAKPNGTTGLLDSPTARKTASFPLEGSIPVVKRGRGRPPGRPSNAAKAAAAAAAIAAAQTALGSPNVPETPPSKKQRVHSPTPNRFNDSLNMSGDSASVSSRSSSPSDSLSDIDVIDHSALRQSGPRTEITDTPTFKKHKKLKANRDLSSGGTVSLDTAPNSSTFENNGASNQMICDNELVAAQYGRKLLDYFMAPEDDKIPDYLIHPPEGFNINHVIDDEGHTAFHWACSMGHLKIIVALLEAGANMNAVNLLGQTPLMRAVMFTNSYDLRSFSKIVDLLRESIFQRDNTQRTVLHHIAESTAPRSKLSSARYYTEIFLAKLSEVESINAIEAFVNRQDVQGDTALHIAARNEARKCVKVLQSYHASSSIRNKVGLTASDYIAESEASRQKNHVTTPHLPQNTGTFSNNTYPDHGYPQYQYANTGENGGYGRQASSPTHAYTHVYSYDPTSTPAAAPVEKRYGAATTPASRYQYDAHVATTTATNNNSNNNNSQAPASETGGKVISKFTPLVSEKLEQLANIYNSLIFDKKNDAEQVRQLVSNVNDDVKATFAQIKEQIDSHGVEEEAEAKSKAAENLVNERIQQLRRVVGRSQARDLAELVKQEEAKARPEYQEELDRKTASGSEPPVGNGAGNGASNGNGSGADRSDSTATVKDEEISEETAELAGLAMELLDLQRRRNEHVTDILDVWSSAGTGEKMHQYRRLIAMSCGAKMDDIDENMLTQIEQVLNEGGAAS